MREKFLPIASLCDLCQVSSDFYQVTDVITGPIIMLAVHSASCP